VGFGAVFFPTGTYVVTRSARGTDDGHGRYTQGGTSTFPIVADVQEVEGDTLRDLPEGMRSEDMRVLYTMSELVALVDDAAAPTEPDHVSIEGAAWRVVKVQRFRVFARRYRVWVERVRTS
jgi:hypothetical protein